MEKQTITGLIDFIAEGPTEFPKGSGKFDLSMKVKGEFYNRYGTEEALKKFRSRLKKGFEVSIIVEGKAITGLEVISDKVATPAKNQSSGSKFNSDDLVKFKDLLDDAHKKGLDKIVTQHVEIDNEKKYALFKAVVYMKVPKTKVGELETEEMVKEYHAYGDASADNVSIMIAPHFIRMAETRAIARALRWATNNGATAEEETEEGQLPEGK